MRERWVPQGPELVPFSSNTTGSVFTIPRPRMIPFTTAPCYFDIVFLLRTGVTYNMYNLRETKRDGQQAKMFIFSAISLHEIKDKRYHLKCTTTSD